jgi:hypothetical protein
LADFFLNGKPVGNYVLGAGLSNAAKRVYYATDDVAAEPVGGTDAAFNVHEVARSKLAKVRAPVGLGHEVGEERLAVHLGDGEIDAVDGDGVAEV